MSELRVRGDARRVALAHERLYEVVLDRETGQCLSLETFLGGGDYGTIVNGKRVALENDLVEDRVRYVCPWCESPMVLRSIPTRDRSEERFYFKHKDATDECRGIQGLSADEISARKFAHSKEGAEHKRFKRLVAESLDADPQFSGTLTEARWTDVEGTRWRQPDVQSQWRGKRVAFEVQLSTTFLHVLAGRMSFYRRNQGLLLWLFRDLNSDQFRLAEDDLFYSNNRNAFRVTEATVSLSQERRQFMLECLWHEPRWEANAITSVPKSRIVAFDELSFDVGDSGAPRAYFFDYGGTVQMLAQGREAQAQQDAADQDRQLRESMEAAVVTFERAGDGGPTWQALRRRFFRRGFELPLHLLSDPSPFYLLQAAYSAKAGRPVACGLPNLISLANNLFQRHKSALWVFTVLLTHFQQEAVFRANGDITRWKKRRGEYRKGWLDGAPEYAPDRRFDSLLAFLFPDAAPALGRAPAEVERARLRREATPDSRAGRPSP